MVTTLPSWVSTYPSIYNWWALAILVKLFVWLNYSDISFPNKYPAPLGEIPHPLVILSGSDHKRSQIGPSWGTSYFLSNLLISSILSKEGERPPCKEKIEFSTIAHKGKKSKTSVKYFQTLEFPYFLTDSS